MISILGLIVCRFARACGMDTKALRFRAVAKAAGKVRMEGKDYVMHDGDVVEFRSGLTSGGKK